MRLGAAIAMPLVVALKPIAQRVGGRFLACRIQGCLDHITISQRVVAEPIDRFATHQFGEIGRIHLDRRLMRLREVPLMHRRVVIGRADEMVVAHAPEHIATSLKRALRAAERIAGRGELRDRCQHRAFGESQLVQRLAVIKLRRRDHAVRAVAEETLVEVQLEDFILAERSLDAKREEDLRQLARVADFRTQEEHARDLLGDRAAACDMLVAGGHGQPDRARDAADVDAAMGVEIGILGGEERLFQALGNVFDAHRRALGLAERRNQLAVGGPYPERHLQAHVLERFDRGQPRRDQPIGGAERETAEKDAGQRQIERIAQQAKKEGHAAGLVMPVKVCAVSVGEYRAYGSTRHGRQGGRFEGYLRQAPVWAQF